jgi:hypothetical protein
MLFPFSCWPGARAGGFRPQLPRAERDYNTLWENAQSDAQYFSKCLCLMAASREYLLVLVLVLSFLSLTTAPLCRPILFPFLPTTVDAPSGRSSRFPIRTRTYEQLPYV